MFFNPLPLCMLGENHDFLSSSDFFFQNLNLSGIPSECQTVWSQIRTDVMSGLIWPQIICKDLILSIDDTRRRSINNVLTNIRNIYSFMHLNQIFRSVWYSLTYIIRWPQVRSLWYRVYIYGVGITSAKLIRMRETKTQSVCALQFPASQYI